MSRIPPFEDTYVKLITSDSFQHPEQIVAHITHRCVELEKENKRLHETSLNIHQLTNKVKDINRRLTLSNELKLNYKKKWEEQREITVKQDSIITNLKQQIDEFREKGKAAEKRVRELMNQHKASLTKLQNKGMNDELTNHNLHQELEEKNQQIRELYQTISTLQTNIIHQQDEVNRINKVLHQEKEEYTNERSLLQRNIVELITQKIGIEERKSFLDEENSLLKSSNAILLQDKQTLQLQVISVQQELQNTIHEIRQKLDAPFQQQPLRTMEETKNRIMKDKYLASGSSSFSESPLHRGDLLEPSSTTSAITDTSAQTSEPTSTSSLSRIPESPSIHTGNDESSTVLTKIVPLSRSLHHQHAHEKGTEKIASKDSTDSPSKRRSSWSRTPRFFIPFQEKLIHASSGDAMDRSIRNERDGKKIRASPTITRSLVRPNKPLSTSSAGTTDKGVKKDMEELRNK